MQLMVGIPAALATVSDGCGVQDRLMDTHMGSYARAHFPKAKLWQNYRVRSCVIASSPASDPSVSDCEQNDEMRLYSL
jgi:hypothetical protein